MQSPHLLSITCQPVKRYRILLILRIVGLAVTAGALAWLVLETHLYEAWLLAGALLVWQAASLLRQATGAVRDLTRLLEAVRASDFSQRLPTEGRGPLIQHFGAAFDEVADEFKRLRAEKQEQVRYLENVVRHVGVALIAFRADGSVELINRAARRLLSVHPVRHIDALEEEVSRPLAEALRRLSSGEQTLVKVPEGGAPDDDGQTLQLSVYATRFRLRGEEHVLASMQDIRNELEEKEMEAWQQLTRVLTHEIMNSVAPIASLAGTASRLLGEGAQEREEAGEAEERRRDTREALETIERRSEALMSFVDAYRSFTRIPPPTFEMIEVEKLFRRVRRLASAQVSEGARRQAVAVEVDVDPPGLTLTADPNLVEQVLINLTLNSVQALEGASAEENPDPKVVLRARPGASGVPYLQVIDNGPGIPAEVQERIFVPFFTTKDDGSGIGLSLTRQIMRLHGGTVSVRSSASDALNVEDFPGAVTAFTLRF